MGSHVSEDDITDGVAEARALRNTCVLWDAVPEAREAEAAEKDDAAWSPEETEAEEGEVETPDPVWLEPPDAVAAATSDPAPFASAKCSNFLVLRRRTAQHALRI